MRESGKLSFFLAILLLHWQGKGWNLAKTPYKFKAGLIIYREIRNHPDMEENE